ncbi:hypothetical protein EBU71_05245 [bacterium]|nr:hypothetical protein [Candidatus Elulimicrobium humile]
MNKKLIDKIDLIIQDILDLQEAVDFDTSDTSEYDLDSAVETLMHLKGQLLCQEGEPEKIDLNEL